jgi:hypothetical protein
MLDLLQKNLIHFTNKTTELVDTLESTYLIRRRDIQLRRNLILHQAVDYGVLEGEVNLEK